MEKTKKSTKRLKTAKKLQKVVTDYYIQCISAKAEGKSVGWMPPMNGAIEIFYAMDLQPVFPENWSPVCAAFGMAPANFEVSAGMGYSRDLCGYLRNIIGYVHGPMNDETVPFGGLPEPDILHRTIHYFTEPQVGMVQSRWGHLNRDYSLLTESQAILLDGHFAIEHVARNRSGRFMSFNGTAGIWRKGCIEAAGGWHHDTLAEDLDLSYRAQMQGWKFLFLPELVNPRPGSPKSAWGLKNSGLTPSMSRSMRKSSIV